MEKPKHKSKARSYRPRTVIEAQRRVLWTAFRLLSNERQSFRNTLKADTSGGLWTYNELLHHIASAAELKVKYR